MLLHVLASIRFRDCRFGCCYIYASQIFVIQEKNICFTFLGGCSCPQGLRFVG